MGEPTIPEAAVEAAAKAIHRSSCRCEMNPGPHADVFLEEARAALAAAEPLMHPGYHAMIDALYEDNARLREALFKIAFMTQGTGTHDACHAQAAAALAPSTEEGT